MSREIRRNGKIATLRHGRVEHKCDECRYPIYRDDYYWEIVPGGGGLGNTKFPTRTHVGNCFEINLERKDARQ